MHIIVLGYKGLLGSKFYQTLQIENNKVIGIGREECDLSKEDKIISFLKSQRNIDWIINCAGMVKSRQEKESADFSSINTRLPLLLERLCPENTRIVHFSTDCVFDGKKKGEKYTEEDIPDAKDIYGWTKMEGEIYRAGNALTLRTSFIGFEPNGSRGLLSWLLSRKNMEVNGYQNHLWTGLTTTEIVSFVSRYILPNKENTGQLLHLSGGTITKYKLLELLQSILSLNIKVIPTFSPEGFINRQLDNKKLLSLFSNYKLPSWEEMAFSLKKEINGL